MFHKSLDLYSIFPTPQKGSVFEAALRHALFDGPRPRRAKYIVAKPKRMAPKMVNRSAVPVGSATMTKGMIIEFCRTHSDFYTQQLCDWVQSKIDWPVKSDTITRKFRELRQRGRLKIEAYEDCAYHYRVIV